MLENLAPAGNPEALDRAVAAGADAVYLGCSAFSARAGAGNFDADQLKEAVSFAHLHHVRVHVTVNTLLKDAELPEVLRLLRMLDELRVDAVLVQDLGVLDLARTYVPSLPIHASTQMALHNAAGARFAKQAGMVRAVLARECSAGEIALCAAEGIEIEVFGHGAQCVAVSGECLFSSMLGERSGNRGRCAQPCRLTFTWQGKRGAWLSPRDVCLRNDLPALAKAGACSVKLEGRLKRPEYVAVVASAYRRGIDSLAHGTFMPADEDEMRGLRQIFQRGGFMRGYAMHTEDAGVIAPERVNHGGVPIGTVTAVRGGLAQCRVTLTLHDGDQLQLRGAAGDCEMIYSGHEVPAGETAVLRLRPDMRVRPGDEAVRLVDNAQLEAARAMTIPPIPVTMALEAMPGRPLRLTVTDGISTVTAEGPETAAARNRAMTEEDAVRSLGKTGDTPFAAEQIRVKTEGAFVAVSVLNALRRDALERLTAARAEAFARPVPEAAALPDELPDELPAGNMRPVVILRSPEQLETAEAMIDGENALIALDPEDWREEALQALLAQMPAGCWLRLPTVCEQATLDMIHHVVTGAREKLGGVILGSVGQLGMDWPVPYAAGSGIPVMNRRAARFLLDRGCVFVTASCELTGRELETLLRGRPPIVVQAWGRTQLMLLHHCPARTALGLTEGHAACRMCDTGSPDALAGTCLEDRRGTRYPLLRQRLPEGCLVRLMNALPTDVRRQIQQAGYPMMIELTDETRPPDAETETTSGHWQRSVE